MFATNTGFFQKKKRKKKKNHPTARFLVQLVMAFAASFVLQRLLAKLTPESENNDPRIFLEDVRGRECR